MSKYNSKKCIIDWHKFDSKIEWEFYLRLKDFRKWKQFEIHPKFELQPRFIDIAEWKFIRPIFYEADFSYDDIVIDIKWLPTEWAKLKRKMFMYRYPQKVLKRFVKYQWKRVDYFENEKRKKANKKNKVR